MEDLLAITLIFGGGGLFLFSISPIGRAIAARIRGGADVNDSLVQELQDTVHDLIEDNRTLRDELVEVQERMDFAERMLSSGGREDP